MISASRSTTIGPAAAADAAIVTRVDCDRFGEGCWLVAADNAAINSINY